jgi:transposase InsO family protein
VKRLRDLCRAPAPDLSVFRRRGVARQRSQRQQEHDVRSRVVALAQWTGNLGWTCGEIAERLQLSPRTLRQWQADLRCQRLRPQPLGRPTCRSSTGQRNAVLALLDEWGPALGVPALQASFPWMARAELDDLLRRYRRVWRKRHYQAPHVLHWQVAGSVWAMDFTEAPAAIDGLYEYLLAVRDLASGRQLLWLPIGNASAAATTAALASLFARHGAPLVLKSDNGSPFSADDTLALVHRAGVIPLFSPPYTPRYNGAIEAGIGSLKTRTEQQATRHGRPGHWTWDDVAAARLEANATARPRGPRGPSPDDAWTGRQPLTAEERARFHASLQRLRHEVRLQEGYPAQEPLAVRDDRAVDRIAIRRALCEHGYLLFSRRRLPLPFSKKKAADIT